MTDDVAQPDQAGEQSAAASLAQATPARIARLAGSALIVLAAEPLYLMWDLAVVGRLGASELAALGVASLVLGVISTQLTFLSYGTTARSARAYGRGDRTGAIDEGMSASWLAVIAGAVIIAAVWPTAPYIFDVLTGHHDIASAATSWLRIAVFGVPLILLSMAGNGWMRGVQDTRRPIIYVVTGLGLSAVLCPLLVHGIAGAPRLGLEGSAWANVIGQSVAGLAFVISVVAAARGRVRPRWSLIRSQLRMGRDLIVRSLSFQICFLSAAAVASRFGVAAVAAHQVVMQVWNFVSLLLDALAIAAQALVGAALGAGAVAVAKSVAWRVTIASFAASAVLALVFALGRSVLPRLFTGSASVLDAIAVPWWFLVVMLPVAGVVFALDGVLLGSGDAAFLRTATLASALVGFLPAIWMSLAFGWGLTGIWSGLLIFLLARLLTQVLRIRSGRWTSIEL